MADGSPLRVRANGRGAAAMPWLVGVAVGVAVLGPALRPGSLLNLDLVLTPVTPVPRGVWALGPELSRRVPLGVPVACVAVVGGPAAGKALLLASIALVFAGVWRLTDGLSSIARA